MKECNDAFIVDVDGVVWRDGEPIRRNVEALAHLLQGGAKVVFLTNNSSRSRRMYSEKLSELLGVPVGADQVVNSGYSAAAWLSRRGRHRVLVVGEEGLVEELLLAGLEIVGPGDWPKATAVAVGLDRELSYTRLAAAHKAILNGALFVATNSDASYPVPGGTEPGAGAIVSALATSTGRKPDFDAGKPSRWILSLALEAAGNPRNPVVIGDRVETDIVMALEAGMEALLVLTGVTRADPGLEGVMVARDIAEALEKGYIRPCRTMAGAQPSQRSLP